MSAPRTNFSKQQRRHRGPLIGMALVALFGVLLIVYWIFEEAATADNPQDSVVPGQESQIESGEAPGGTPVTPEAAPTPEQVQPRALPTEPSGTQPPATDPVNE
jgi:hypothetical protein